LPEQINQLKICQLDAYIKTMNKQAEEKGGKKTHNAEELAFLVPATTEKAKEYRTELYQKKKAELLNG